MDPWKKHSESSKISQDEFYSSVSICSGAGEMCNENLLCGPQLTCTKSSMWRRSTCEGVATTDSPTTTTTDSPTTTTTGSTTTTLTLLPRLQFLQFLQRPPVPQPKLNAFPTVIKDGHHGLTISIKCIGWINYHYKMYNLPL
ncbi:hypothetical protein CEXT_214061 [Caerostris extrusa]|uniref:Uncharacterized protein n=1 Tax=Caerostris extrusa TaxID=172846 RepID=A0AAV4Y4P4_CAEEX|nr:hypothetical protein CEXT_214061 [Caerostris extrusa]